MSPSALGSGASLIDRGLTVVGPWREVLAMAGVELDPPQRSGVYTVSPAPIGPC